MLLEFYSYIKFILILEKQKEKDEKNQAITRFNEEKEGIKAQAREDCNAKNSMIDNEIAKIKAEIKRQIEQYTKQKSHEKDLKILTINDRISELEREKDNDPEASKEIADLQKKKESINADYENVIANFETYIRGTFNDRINEFNEIKKENLENTNKFIEAVDRGDIQDFIGKTENQNNRELNSNVNQNQNDSQEQTESQDAHQSQQENNQEEQQEEQKNQQGQPEYQQGPQEYQPMQQNVGQVEKNTISVRVGTDGKMYYVCGNIKEQFSKERINDTSETNDYNFIRLKRRLVKYYGLSKEDFKKIDLCMFKFIENNSSALGIDVRDYLDFIQGKRTLESLPINLDYDFTMNGKMTLGDKKFARNIGKNVVNSNIPITGYKSIAGLFEKIFRRGQPTKELAIMAKNNKKRFR